MARDGRRKRYAVVDAVLAWIFDGGVAEADGDAPGDGAFGFKTTGAEAGELMNVAIGALGDDGQDVTDMGTAGGAIRASTDLETDLGIGAKKIQGAGARGGLLGTASERLKIFLQCAG